MMVVAKVEIQYKVFIDISLLMWPSHTRTVTGTIPNDDDDDDDEDDEEEQEDDDDDSIHTQNTNGRFTHW